MEVVMRNYVLMAGLLCAFQMSYAGNLEPSEAPGPTMKPLDQVEPRIPISYAPFTISQPGSYYLTKNLNAPGTGIYVNANDVTIDFCGFTLTGLSTNGTYGVLINGQNNVEIRNGTIRSFAYGINENNTAARNHRIMDMRILYNKWSGIQLYGQGHTIRGCTVAHNGLPGAAGTVFAINSGTRATVTGNTLYDNGNSSTISIYVISSGDGSLVTDNSCTENGASATGALYVIRTGYGSLVSGNNVSFNGNSASSVYGFYISSGTVVRNTACNNGISATGPVFGFNLTQCLYDQNTAVNNNGTNMLASGTAGTNYAP
jgi:hypothetical protein